jgi:hypothetical protein
MKSGLVCLLLLLVLVTVTSTSGAECTAAEGGARLGQKLVAIDINCHISEGRTLVVRARIPGDSRWIICWHRMSKDYLANDAINAFKEKMRSGFGGYENLTVEWYPSSPR